MKKIMFVAALLVTAVSVSAQNFRLGVTAGANISNMSLKDEGYSLSCDSKVGFNVGVKAELGLPSVAEGLFVDAALLYAQKGTKFEEEGRKEVFNMGYLELPLHIGYKYAINDNFAIFGQVGPYVSYGLDGKMKVDHDGGSYDLNLFKETKDERDTYAAPLNRFDAGLSVGIGVEFVKNIQLKFDYSKGLANITHKIEDAYFDKASNSNFSVGLAYMF